MRNWIGKKETDEKMNKNKETGNEQFDCLMLENQLCFPLYACAKEVTRKYREPLQPLGLTYTQYIVMMVLWEYGSTTAKDLGEKLYLDSGTLTPLLKRLEKQGLITRCRRDDDERMLVIDLTEEGEALKYEARKVPEQISRCVDLTPEEAQTLYTLLYKALDGMR